MWGTSSPADERAKPTLTRAGMPAARLRAAKSTVYSEQVPRRSSSTSREVLKRTSVSAGSMWSWTQSWRTRAASRLSTCGSGTSRAASSRIAGAPDWM